jgi:hypothetical protein
MNSTIGVAAVTQPTARVIQFRMEHTSPVDSVPDAPCERETTIRLSFVTTTSTR